MQPELSVLCRQEFIATLQMLLNTCEAKEYSTANYYWHTKIDDLLSVYFLHLELLSDDADDGSNADNGLSAKDELYEFWMNCELAGPFQEKIKTLPLLDSSEFVLALFEQNLLGFFYVQLSRTPNVIDSLIYPITMEIGDSRKQIYLLSRNQLVSFDIPTETFPVVVIKDFLPTLNKVSYLDKGRWYSAEVSPSRFRNSDVAPIKILHQGQLNDAQYTEVITQINNALTLIRGTEENIFSFICVFTSFICITSELADTSATFDAAPGISFLCLEKSNVIANATRIMQSNALHFLNATLVLNDFVIDDSEKVYFDLELNCPCSILDVLRNIQISYWPLIFLLKKFDLMSPSEVADVGIEKLLILILEYNFMTLVYEDYLEHAFQTFKITRDGKDFCEQFIRSVKTLNSKMLSFDEHLKNKFSEDYLKLQQKLKNWQGIKNQHSLNH
ncbi:MAG: hypothetical protein HYV97_13130 [Bdellovibrio sp.]|nr:hypothetical protein [Bdellovibrio sp.]